VPLGLLGLTSRPSRAFILFDILLCACDVTRLSGHFPPPIYSACGVALIFTSHLLAALSFALTIPPSLLQFFFGASRLVS
jgi:hypothetical protein